MADHIEIRASVKGFVLPKVPRRVDESVDPVFNEQGIGRFEMAGSVVRIRTGARGTVICDVCIEAPILEDCTPVARFHVPLEVPLALGASVVVSALAQFWPVDETGPLVGEVREAIVREQRCQY